MANSFSAVLVMTVASVCFYSRVSVASVRAKINFVATVFSSPAANGLVFMRSDERRYGKEVETRKDAMSIGRID